MVLKKTKKHTILGQFALYFDTTNLYFSNIQKKFDFGQFIKTMVQMGGTHEGGLTLRMPLHFF